MYAIIIYMINRICDKGKRNLHQLKLELDWFWKADLHPSWLITFPALVNFLILHQWQNTVLKELISRNCHNPVSFFIIHQRWKSFHQNPGGGMDKRSVSIKLIPPLQSNPVLYACTPARWDNICNCSSSSTYQDRVPAGSVQAWPMPLIGAGLIQNLHQVAVDETAQVLKQ